MMVPLTLHQIRLGGKEAIIGWEDGRALRPLSYLGLQFSFTEIAPLRSPIAAQPRVATALISVTDRQRQRVSATVIQGSVSSLLDSWHRS
jgi:hypothetical protein